MSKNLKASSSILWLFLFTSVPALSQSMPSNALPAPQPDSARAAATANVNAALSRRDYSQAIAIEKEWVSNHPTDLDFRHSEPMMYLLSGNLAEWENARKNLLQTWVGIKGMAPPPKDPSFTLEVSRLAAMSLSPISVTSAPAGLA